jgi:hypothetical protein
LSTSSEFIIYSSKQGNRVTVLGRAKLDIVVIGKWVTCDGYSLDVNILGKAAVLHFALSLFCGWGLCPFQLADYWT